MLFDANTTQSHGRDLISFKAPKFGAIYVYTRFWTPKWFLMISFAA